MRQIFLLLIYLVYSEACVRTSGGGSVDTTTIAGVTTTATGSSSCSVDNFNANRPNPADPTDPLTHPADKMAGTPQNGLSTMVLTCTHLDANQITSMSLFFTEDGTMSADVGDANTPLPTISATLVCNTSGQWTYTQSGVTKVIVAANCDG